MTNKRPDKEKLRLRMASLCARSEQCSGDIRRKLLNAGLSAADTEEIIQELKERKFIDDRRFAAAYARDKVVFSAWGRRKIRLNLMARRIGSDLIDYALDSVDAKDYAVAILRAARAKARSLDIEDFNDRQKLMRHLLSRGFETDIASKAVRKLEADAKNKRDGDA